MQRSFGWAVVQQDIGQVIYDCGNSIQRPLSCPVLYNTCWIVVLLGYVPYLTDTRSLSNRYRNCNTGSWLIYVYLYIIARVSPLLTLSPSPLSGSGWLLLLLLNIYMWIFHDWESGRPFHLSKYIAASYIQFLKRFTYCAVVLMFFFFVLLFLARTLRKLSRIC